MIYRMISGGFVRKADEVERTLNLGLDRLKEQGLDVKKVTPVTGDAMVSFFIECKSTKKYEDYLESLKPRTEEVESTEE